jgi:hypothetical protein
MGSTLSVRNPENQPSSSNWGSALYEIEMVGAVAVGEIAEFVRARTR